MRRIVDAFAEYERLVIKARTRAALAVKRTRGERIDGIPYGFHRSSRTMARTGLRMMPTFPSSPLRFRTAGFPRYGSKASLSDSTFLDRPAVKPAPDMPASPPSLLPFAGFHHGALAWLWVQPGPGFRWPLRERPCLSTPGVLGSGAGSAVPLPHRLNRPHPPVSPARGDFAALLFIRRAFAVRERRGDPRDLPHFHRCAFHARRRPYTGGSPAPFPLCARVGYQAASDYQRVATHKCPSLPAILDGVMHFGAASFASCYGSCVCPALPAGYDEVKSAALLLRLLRHRVVPAFDAVCRQAALGIWLDGRTGNLPSSGLSPDKSQQLSVAAR